MQVEFKKLEYNNIEMVRNWRNSDDIAKYMYNSNIITTEQQEAWFKRISKDETQEYFIIQYQNNPVGLVSFNAIDKHNSSCEWAFYLVDENAKKRGVAIVTEFLAIEYVFKELKLNKLKCAVLDFNNKVISLHKKFGFVEEGILRKEKNKDGNFYDVYLFSLFDYEWKIIYPKFTKIIERYI